MSRRPGIGGDGRAPRGARGLKFQLFRLFSGLLRRAPRGARGLKSGAGRDAPTAKPRRAPRGARGLKYHQKMRFYK